ncbi:MAG: spinster family MFS transporter [Sphingobium sp.]
MTGLPASSTGSRHYLLAMLTLIYAVSFIDRTVINVLAQPIKAELGLTDAQLGLVSGSAFALLYASMGLPLARIAERYSRRNLIAVSLSVWSLATAACGLAGQFWHLFLARVGVGIGEAGSTPASHSMLADMYRPEERPLALSIFSIGIPIGTIFGAFLGGWIGQTMGWRMAFLLLGLPGIAIALLFRFTITEPIRTAPVAAHEHVGAALRQLWRVVAFRYLVAGFTFAAMGGYSIGAFMIAWLLRRHGMTLADASYAFGTVSGFAGIVGMLLGGVLAGALSRRDVRMQSWIPAVAMLITGIFLILCFRQSDLMSLAFFAVPAALCYSIYVGPGYAAIQNVTPAHLRSTSSAVVLLISTLIGMGLGPPITGWISDRAGANCTAAGVCADGLSFALMIASTSYLLAAVCFTVAGFYIRHKKEAMAHEH